jgi:hypothetical protein
VQLLDQLHANTDWVVTADRFFGVDYYDSPNDDELGVVARKYLIDYSPEFTEGLGQRVIVTTAWRDEVAMILHRAMEDLGFAAVERSVGRVLHYLKTVSGRLALQALGPDSGGAAAVSLGAVMSWLQSNRRLKQAVVVPVDTHIDLFGPRSKGQIDAGQRRCDLVLIGLKRGIVEATFIEVKWRRGPLGNIDDLAEDMNRQMQMTSDAVYDRFFSPDRADGALQRAYLANVLRFYCARAQRYGLLEPGAASTFLTHLAQFEKAGLDFRPFFEGFIVSLEDPGRRPFVLDNLTIRVLTARDFERDDDALGSGVPSASQPVPATTGGDGKAVSDEPPSADGRPSQTVSVSTADNDLPVLPIPDERKSDGAEAAPSVSTLPAQVDVVLGETMSGNDVIWTPSVKGSPHMFITGIPGQGKSYTIRRVLIDLSRQAVPALVFDFHGDLGDPSGPYAIKAKPTIVNAAEGLPFSPFDCTADNTVAGWNATAMAVAEIFGYVCGLGDIQQDVLYTCIRDAYRACGFGGSDVDGPMAGEFPSLHDVQRRIERAENDRQSQHLMARCRPLLEMNIFRPELATHASLLDAVRQGMVIDFHALVSETVQLAASAFVLRKVYRDMFTWGQADRLRLVIVLDEAHRLAKDITLPKLMKEGRKYGVAVVVASQGLADLHTDVVGNAGAKVAFRANHLESKKIAGFFRGRPGTDLVAQIEGLTVGQALVQTPEMPMAARVQMRPPEE